MANATQTNLELSQAFDHIVYSNVASSTCQNALTASNRLTNDFNHRRGLVNEPQSASAQ
jgi:hypothetical protein